ncbi:MAG: rubredoxin, partial [Bacteroidota bacterium]
SYYQRLEEAKTSKAIEKPASAPKEHDIYQCQKCLTIYDERYGDSNAGIEKGMSFDQLPNSYECSLCGAGKEYFELVTASRK